MNEHPHGPDLTSLVIKEKRRKIKETITAIAKVVPNVSPRQILTNFATQIKDNYSFAVMPIYSADRQVIKRKKKN